MTDEQSRQNSITGVAGGAANPPAESSTGQQIGLQPPVVPPTPIVLTGEWTEIDKEIAFRHVLISNAVARLSNYTTDKVELLNLAATDVFVEKAQHRLTTRAKKFMWWGGITGGVAVLTLLCAASLLLATPPDKLLGGKTDVYHLIAAVIRAISIGGFVGGAVYFLGGLSSALIHEAVVLLNRRHALRFGRLSVYLQGGKVDPAMLHDLFRWNDEFSSAFKTIKPEEIRKGGLSGFVEPPSKTLEGAAKLAESVRPETRTAG